MKNNASEIAPISIVKICRLICSVATAMGCAVTANPVQAIKLIGDKCEFTAEELSDPDKVVKLRLQGERTCSDVYVARDLYGTVQLPHFGTWPRVHPEVAIPRLLRRYGVPKREPFEPGGGTYREFRILGKRALDPIEDHSAVEYTVELLYVRLSTWQQVPGSGKYGTVPVCERNTTNVIAIEYRGNWYVDMPPGIGKSVVHGVRATTNRNWDDANIARDLANDKRVEDLCKVHLN